MKQIDEILLAHLQATVRSSSTHQGIELLSLEALEGELREKHPHLIKKYSVNFIVAGNEYLTALRLIHELMKELGIDDQLYEES